VPAKAAICSAAAGPVAMAPEVETSQPRSDTESVAFTLPSIAIRPLGEKRHIAVHQALDALRVDDACGLISWSRKASSGSTPKGCRR